MTFSPDTPLVRRVYPAPMSERYGREGLAIRIFLVHMAEGGGTEYYLDNLDGNSSHYVIKYSGELVQMVPERYAAGSVNPRLIRTTDDRPFTFLGERIQYGITALKRAMGGLPVGYINLVSIAIEIEGFALEGPNEAQSLTLKRLWEDVKRRRPQVVALGHRDAQSYKRCPGPRIAWSALGGHGGTVSLPEIPLPDTSTEDTSILLNVGGATIGLATMTHPSGSAFRTDGKTRSVPAGTPRNVYAEVTLGEKISESLDVGEPMYVVSFDGGEMWLLRQADCTFVPKTTADTTPFSQADLDAAVAKVKASARIVFP